jgi:diguanylate cyclase (GGDEF)-like protein
MIATFLTKARDCSSTCGRISDQLEENRWNRTTTTITLVRLTGCSLRPRLRLAGADCGRGGGPVELSGVWVVSSNLTTRDEIEQQLALHASQHEAVARLGQLALREHDLRTLIDEIVTTLADVLDVELCAVLKLREDEEILDIVAKVGFKDGPEALPAGNGTQAGYALSTHQPVVTEDFRTETRFNAQSLLDKGMISGMKSIIEGHERPFGVLGAHTTRRRRFSTDDVNFLAAVANLLSAAIEQHRREELSRHAALHDPLTGLPNRTLALDRLDLALARRRRDGTDVAMVMLDLDHFKVINDSLGHVVGDQLLIALSIRLQEMLRPTDTVARLSGDEFVVVCESEGGVRQFVELAERIGTTASRPFALTSGEHSLTASIGVAVAEGSDDTSASLLRDADAAMYRAKKRGPGRYELFDVTVRAQVLARLRAEQELRYALEQGQLCVHYQPIIDVASGKPVATEALVRWMHPHHGLIPPLDFIQIAEETGIIIDLGRHVLEAACEQGAAWQRQFDLPLQMYVNVSGCQIANSLFPAEVADIARRYNLLPGTLGLEVTESVLIEEVDSPVTVLSELHEHGLRLMLDDFGTGYSSLSYLRRFPLNGVKVDRSFTDALDSSPQNVAILRAIVEMCHALGLTVVGEGVESAAQLKQLSRLGCEHAQGYLLCHPMPAEEIGAYFQRRLSSGAIEMAANGRSASPA